MWCFQMSVTNSQVRCSSLHNLSINQSYDLVMFGLYSPFLSCWIHHHWARPPLFENIFCFDFVNVQLLLTCNVKNMYFFLYSNYRNIGYMWLGIKSISRSQVFYHAGTVLKFLDPPLLKSGNACMQLCYTILPLRSLQRIDGITF